ncbi:FAD/NAD(P)-binding protein [Streptomyces polygonati]|uniref:FAD/NAD(P)-binding protein n=1 Tax=Streptomyces polygonati TaxID=1617087 RepID=A0ABV8HTJ3_9ACTN
MTGIDTNAPTCVAIVGGGPSCTYVLDRLAATVAARERPPALEVHVYDRSGNFGAGQVHSPGQPETSFLNRIVGQVAFAADESVLGAGPLLDPADRPTLLEWCRARFEQTGDPVFDLKAEDWPKRYVHGLALRDQFERYVGLLRSVPGVSVHLHPAEVVDLAEREAGRLAVITSRGGEPVVADHVLMLTGHSSNDPRHYPLQAAWSDFARRNGVGFIPSAYPLETSIEESAATPEQVVGCVGMGLTAIDVILHLTEGRGGVFERQPDGSTVYRPSGREPASIVVFSRSGLFTFARPFNAKEKNPQELEHTGVFLTEPAIDRLRVSAGRPVRIGQREQYQLDFRRHVLPLIVLEMAQLYYTTLFGAEFGSHLRARALPGWEEFLADGGAERSAEESTDRLLAPVEAAVDQAVGYVDGVLTGAVPPRTELPWDRERLLRRYLAVVFGRARGAELAGLLDDPLALASALASEVSPWRHPTRAADNRFSWQRTLEPVPRGSYATGEEYRDAVLDFLDLDHRWAAQDNLWNPAKAAADGVWRDLRDVLAHAVDFGGLHAASHRDFLDVFMRHHNRLCNGAALEVMEKVRAAIRHGLVDVSVGPDATLSGDEESGRFLVTGPATGVTRRLDLLVDSRVHPFNARNDVLPLYPSMLRKGLVRIWSNPGQGEPDFTPGGLDLTEDFHPVREDGTVDRRLTLLGPPSEGVMFFQLGALRPNQNHHVMQDILCWINEFWHSQDRGRDDDPGREPSVLLTAGHG